MKLFTCYLLLIFSGTLLLLLFQGTHARALALHKRSAEAGLDLADDPVVQEYEASLTPDEKILFESDIHELEHAIEDEISAKEPKIQEGNLEEVSPENLDKEVTEHNEKKPWYVRLGRYLRGKLHDFVQHTARKLVNDYVIPAVTRSLFGGGGSDEAAPISP